MPFRVQPRFTAKSHPRNVNGPDNCAAQYDDSTTDIINLTHPQLRSVNAFYRNATKCQRGHLTLPSRPAQPPMTGNSKGDESKTPPLVSIIAGGIAGAVEAAATYPFEFAKTRVQLRQEFGVPTPRNPFLVVGQVFRDEGYRALYKGCSSLVVGSVAKDGIRFLSFDTIKNAFADPETGTLSPLRNMAAGMCAGVVASATAVTPTERIKTALIDDARNAKAFRNPVHAVSVIYAEHGILGLYRGFAGTTLKQASATAFRLGTYNILKDWETEREIAQSTATNFANGAVAGIVTTYASQPFDTIKTRAQSAKGASTVEAFASIMADYGIKGFWRGTTMRLGRTIFSGGILFTVYERMVAILHPILGV